MITLGIPGSPTAAVMLGGLIIWGLQPGPMLFKEKPDFVWGLIASMYTGNVIGVLMVLAFVPFFAAILRIPFAILTPLIVSICAVGAYSVHNSMVDVWYMLIFGVVGYAFKKLDYPLAPLVLALVLGDLADAIIAGDHARAGAALEVGLRQVAPGQVAVLRSRHLLPRGQVEPELQPADSLGTHLRHLLVKDAAPRGHPLDVAGADRPVVPERVSMLHFARAHDRDGLDPSMRMVREAGLVIAGVDRLEVIEEQERIEVVARPGAEAAPQTHPRALHHRLRRHDLHDGT